MDLPPQHGARRRFRIDAGMARLATRETQCDADHPGARDQHGLALCGTRRRRRAARDLRDHRNTAAAGARGTGTYRDMILGTIFVVFVVLVLLSLPIVFALGLAAVAGLLVADLPLQIIASSVVSGTQSWVLLAIPSFIFAGLLMERCGMSQALVGLARAMVGWLPGGLGMTVVACAYLFSDLCGSIMAEVSSLSSLLMKPLERAGYRKEDAASLIAAGAAMGMLVPPAIFMLVISVVTNTSAVALFLAGFIPAAVMAVCLCVLILFRARKYGWPRDMDTSFPKFLTALRVAFVPLLVPV